MRFKRITSIVIGGERIEIVEGRTPNYEKCAVAYFAGPEGWGVTMDIQFDELETFVNDAQWQKKFIAFAKEKLGIEYEPI